MKITWCNYRNKWLIKPGDMSKEEEKIVCNEDLSPSVYDNWEDGDIYMYPSDFPIGYLISILYENNLNLELGVED